MGADRADEYHFLLVKRGKLPLDVSCCGESLSYAINGSTKKSSGDHHRESNEPIYQF